MPRATALRAALAAASLSLISVCPHGALTPARADVPETVLHTFTNANSDGETPYAGLVEASDGTFYGTTFHGGSAGYGTVFKIATDGTLTILHNFDDGTVGNDGIEPNDTLAIGSDGNLYGTTELGGATSHGTVFKMTPAGQETILHSFAGTSDGYGPSAGVTFGTDGLMYGTTHLSDSDSSADYGTLYSLSTSGGSYLVQFRFNDQNQAEDGAEVFCTLAPVPGSTSNQFYGMCDMGGTGGEGTVFKFTPGTNDGGGTVTVVHNFDDGSVSGDGAQPYLGSIQTDSSGNLYGTTTEGGANNDGIVWKLTPGGSETILHAFSGGSDGQYPFSGVIHASDGNYYGTTYNGGKNNDGAVFRLSSSGGGYDVTYSFGASNDGAAPEGALLEDSDGNLLGMTSQGGDSYGVVYKLASALPNPVKLSSLSLSPTSVQAGANSTGKVSLNKPAPSAGATITLSSSNSSAASVPSSVSIAANHKTATFTITSHSVTSSAKVTISATYNGSTLTKTLTVTPAAGPSLSSVTVASSTVAGGASLSGNRISLTGSATTNAKVSLTSSNPSVAAVPTSETILAGSTSHSFTITTTSVTAPTAVTISASYDGVAKTASLTVEPSLSSVKPAASSAKGGTSLTGNRIYFTGDVNANTTVTLTSSNTSAATVPSMETILSGSSSHSFTVTTKAVTSNQTVTITAASGGVTKTATLTVTP